MKPRSLKLSKELEDALTDFAAARGSSSSSVVREALAEYLGTNAAVRRGPESFSAKAADLAGCVEGALDLASNPTHMTGYGAPMAAAGGAAPARRPRRKK
jgi:hypothetical protein